MPALQCKGSAEGQHASTDGAKTDVQKGEIGRVIRGVIECKQDQFQGLVTSTYIRMVYSREHGLLGLGEG
jgi:hypothetical protein